MCKISILVPIYNVENYIERCAISLFEQSYDDVEYIFVNDCTKDKSIQILENVLERYPSRKAKVKIINHERNTGLGGARLTGLNNATGDYIWCVDSDDWIERQAIEKLLSYIKQGYDYIVFNYFLERKEETVKFYNKELTVNNVLYTAVSPSIWKCIVKRSLFFDYAIFPVEGVNQAEDFLLTARLILVAQSPILISNLFLYHYNLINTNSYVNNITLKSMESTAKACLLVEDFYKEKGFLNDYRISLAIRMAFWYKDFVKIDKNHQLCQKLKKEIYRLDKVVYYITQVPFLNQEWLIRLYRKIRIKE